MSDTPVDALLPVLVAELADASARAMVEDLARAGATALVPLIDAPVDASLHVLEVTTPEHDEPLLVLAEPVGAPTEHGFFPLRLHPYGSPPSTTSARPSEGALPSLRATRSRPTTLTKHHTRDLLGEASPARTGSSVEELVGREIAGKLIVENLVGTGGMGAVYRARHKQLGTKVALKVLHEEFRDDLAFCARFHAEALVVSQLDHGNLVRILDYGQEPDGLLYIAMEFLSGVELSNLAREESVPLARIVDIAIQASAGLGHAHGRGIVHRDVKPSNIVLVKADDDEGREIEVVKVCDFGIAARSGTRDLVGTPAYMSPEQCTGAQVDGRSDIYALGVILYELATGQLPFTAESPGKVAEMQIEKAPVRPSLIRPVDARLEELILRMLKKSPSDRPQSMRDLRSSLRALHRPASLRLHQVGVGRQDRSSSAPPPSSTQPPMGPASASQLQPVPDVPAVAARLVLEPVSALREMLESPERFVAEAQVLAAAMRFMLEQKELAALSQVIRIFDKIASDPAGDARSELSRRLVRTLQDPARLAHVADRALTEHEETAPTLLAQLGLAAAHALYAARLRAHPTPPVRGRFVAAMRAVGAAAWPLVATALQRNAPGDAVEHDPRIAEDLLRAMPLVADDGMGGIVSKYLRWGDAAVRRAAIPALVSLWGDRARPFLLAVLLKDTDEGTQVAAVKGLCDLHAIDEHVVRKAEDILADANAGTALRVAIADALAVATETAKPFAEAALRQTLIPKGGVFGGRRAKTKPPPPIVLLAMARSFAALGGEEAAKMVEELGRQCDEPLRTQLLGVVGARV